MVRLKRRVKGKDNGVDSLNSPSILPEKEGLGTAICELPLNGPEARPTALLPPWEHPKAVANRFQPGNKHGNGGKRKDGLPRMGSRNMMDRLWKALDQIEHERGKDYIYELLQSGLKSESVRNTLLSKFLPSKIEDIVTLDDVKKVVGKVVSIVKKHVKDKTTFGLIAAEVATVQLSTSNSPRVGVANAKAGRKKS